MSERNNQMFLIISERMSLFTNEVREEGIHTLFRTSVVNMEHISVDINKNTNLSYCDYTRPKHPAQWLGV